MSAWYSNRHAAAEAAAAAIAAALRGRAGELTIALPGGTTPQSLFDALTKLALPWSRLTIVPTDERWVARDDSASNESLLRSGLVDRLEVAPMLLSLRGAADDLSEAVVQAQASLECLRRPFDAVMLGFGNDGHIASLFPDAVWRKSGAVITAPGTGERHARLSLGYDLIVGARWIGLFFAGDDKIATLTRARYDPNVRDVWPLAALLAAAGERLQLFGAHN